jgi:hypothetical protein
VAQTVAAPATHPIACKWRIQSEAGPVVINEELPHVGAEIHVALRERFEVRERVVAPEDVDVREKERPAAAEDIHCREIEQVESSFRSPRHPPPSTPFKIRALLNGLWELSASFFRMGISRKYFKFFFLIGYSVGFFSSPAS